MLLAELSPQIDARDFKAIVVGASEVALHLFEFLHQTAFGAFEHFWFHLEGSTEPSGQELAEFPVDVRGATLAALRENVD